MPFHCVAIVLFAKLDEIVDVATSIPVFGGGTCAIVSNSLGCCIRSSWSIGVLAQCGASLDRDRADRVKNINLVPNLIFNWLMCGVEMIVLDLLCVPFFGVTPSITHRVIGSRNRGYVGEYVRAEKTDQLPVNRPQLVFHL